MGEMILITVAGPPSSGKTSVILQTLTQLKADGLRIGVVKFDCLSTSDRSLYQRKGLPVITGISANQCPDHFFVSNIEDCVRWGTNQGLDLLISESAGLCNRCSPHIRDIFSVCVVDNLSGVETPRKIGPMLKLADAIVITKGDVVSQAEREVFALRIIQVNRRAVILPVNGITGQGTSALAELFQKAPAVNDLKGRSLRFPMPAALCSYCLGQTRIGEEYQRGNVHKIDLSPKAFLQELPTGNPLGASSEKKDFSAGSTDWSKGKNFLFRSISICGGKDKSGNPENVSLTLRPGDIFCIVGPTGSGKSRLLSDLECLAQKDTPSRREILINGRKPTPSERPFLRHRLIAQISQNMNFVMDLSVEDFLMLHAESREIRNAREIVRGIIEGANELSGEKFGPHWPLTELSGGQSRALMIADTACLSASPVVLIDEIENAGIDRNKAFRLLTKKNKIVLLSTHDPLLALLCQRRILIAGGAIRQIAVSSPEEKDVLSRLEEMDQYQRIVREAIRSGKPIPAHFLFTEEERYVSL